MSRWVIRSTRPPCIGRSLWVLVLTFTFTLHTHFSPPPRRPSIPFSKNDELMLTFPLPRQFLSAHFSFTTLALVPAAYYPTAILPPMGTLPALAHYSAAAGVLTAIPSLVTGFGEGYELIRNQYMIKGSWKKVVDDAWNLKDVGGEKVKTTVTHASMNDAVVGLAGFNWCVAVLRITPPSKTGCTLMVDVLGGTGTSIPTALCRRSRWD